MRTGSHGHCHTELHSIAEAQGGHKPRCRRAAGLRCLALYRRHMSAADPPTRGDRSCRPPSCVRQTPATCVRRSSRVLHTHEAVADRTRGEWMGEHMLVVGMGSRAPRQLYDDVRARGRRRDRRPASCAHAWLLERAELRRALRYKSPAGLARRPHASPPIWLDGESRAPSNHGVPARSGRTAWAAAALRGAPDAFREKASGGGHVGLDHAPRQDTRPPRR